MWTPDFLHCHQMSRHLLYVGSTISSLTPNVEVEWLAVLDLYLGVLDSYLGPMTGHLEVFNISLEFEECIRLVH